MSEAEPRYVGVDCNVLVHAIQRSGPAEAIRRAGWLFEQMEQNKQTPLISSVVVGEYLVGVAPEKQDAVLKVFRGRFFLPAYDAAAARVAAELTRGAADLRRPDRANDRRLIKADAMIVAVAAVHHAERFVSQDRRCRTLAERAGLHAEALPQDNGNLFEMAD